MTITTSATDDVSSIRHDPPSALVELGVRPDTLNADQCSALDRDGFLLIPGHLSINELDALRETHDRLMGEKYADGDSPVRVGGDYWNHEAGTRRLTDLLSEGEIFERIATDPTLLAAVHRLMPIPFKHDTINAREALPGQGGQRLHRDHPRQPDGMPLGVNSAWLLDPFTAENGPTRVIPGSHAWEQGPEDNHSDPTVMYPGERTIIAPPGSVLIFGADLWHGGTVNRSVTSRRVVHCSFIRRQQNLGPRAQRHRIRKATWDRLPPAARWLMEV